MSKTVFKTTITLLLFLINPLNAATITVNGTNGSVVADNICSISEAIINANDNAQTHDDCIAGDGADTIELAKDITLTAEYENNAYFGRTGTPPISSAIILDGQGHVLERNGNLICNLNSTSEASEFRILLVAGSGDLALINTVIRGGCVDGNGNATPNGGGLYNQGTLSLLNTLLDTNQARKSGGGVATNSGDISSITNSTFSNNSARQGAGLFLTNGNITDINNSTFSNNTSQIGGGGILLYLSTILSINNNTFSGNTASSGGSAIYNDATNINNVQNNIFHDGSTCKYLNGPFSAFSGSNNITDSTSGTDCPGILPAELTASSVGPLVDNGCTTPLADGSCIMTHALLAGSEALDVAVSGTSSDQRGFSVYGAIRDIGAYELQGIELCPAALQTDGFNTTVTTDTELIQAIECANFNGDSNGGDTINLNADITLTTEYENHVYFGRTGTPSIISTIVLDGQGHVIERDGNLACNLNLTSESSEFRILWVASDGDLSLNNTVIRGGCVDGNSSGKSNGGGLFNSGTLSLFNTVIEANQAGRNGGGVGNNGGNISSITNSTFSNNSAAQGGGLSLAGTGISSITNSTFSNNNASQGGGLSLEYGEISSITNSTFSNNSAYQGGGLFVTDSSSSVSSIINSTFSDSTIYNFLAKITNMQNNIFHNGSTCIYLVDSGSAFSGSNNIADSTSGTDCPGILPTELTASSVGALADNGCTTPLANGICIMTHALLFGSEAINSSGAGATDSDQRGFSVSGIRDIGAFEAFFPVVVAPADMTFEATGIFTSANFGNATVTDIDEEQALTVTASQSINFELGDTVVTWTSADSYGHIGMATQTITIEDTIPPTVTAPIDITFEATGIQTIVDIGIATATDIAVDDNSLIITSNAPVSYPVGETIVTWSADDSNGNICTVTQTITIEDTIAPILALIGNDTVTLLIGDNFTDAGASATDRVDDDTTLTANIMTINPVNTAVAGTYIITYDVTDTANNPAVQIIRTVNVLATISGTVTGLATGNSVEIQNINGETIQAIADGGFTFITPLALNVDYLVSVPTQPTTPAQMCLVNNADGQITSGNITNVEITCSTNQYFVGGMLSGLTIGNTVILDINSGTQTLTLNSNGAFVFNAPLPDLSNYSIAVQTQPASPSQTCSVLNATGQVNISDVQNIKVNCTDDTFFVGGSITGLGAGFSLILKNNNSDDMTINSSGSFVFATPLLDLLNYDVSMYILPKNTARDCLIDRNAGIISGDDIDDVQITCDFVHDLIYRNGFELLP